MRRAARLVSLLGGVIAVLALSKYHAAFVAEPAYDFTGGPRVWWAIPYVVLIALATYAVGLPDQPRTVLRALWLSLLAGLGAQSIRALAEMEGVRHPTMSRVVDALTAGGWVEREADPSDGRVVLVRLTPKSKREMERLRRHRNASLEAQLEALAPTDRKRVLTALPALERLLEAGDEPAR